MKYLLNIRGANGSGKTTSVRDYLENHKLEDDELELSNGTKVPVNICDNSIVLGRYCGNKTDGLDPFNGEKLQKTIILEAIKKYQSEVIIFESLTMSSGYKPVLRMASMAKSMGYKWIAVYLYLNFDERYKRLCGRAGRPISTLYVTSVLQSCERAMKELSKNGILCKYINTSEIPREDMSNIVNNIINQLTGESNGRDKA